MKRIALLAAAAVATAGCYSSPPPPPPIYYGDVIVYWDFARNTSSGPVLYDGSLVGVGNTACPESGVEYVTVTDLAGLLIDPYTPTISCVYQGVQGATFLTFPEGNYTFVVHGYRTVGGLPVEVHRGQGSVYIYGNTQNQVTVTAAGLQGDLDVFLYQGTNLFQCLGGDALGYTLVDGIGTIIDQASALACVNPIPFRVDLDTLDIRLQVSNGGTVIFDSCTPQPFHHFGNDTAGFGWSVALQVGACP
jgi:hypothetical protein